ncbi:MAG: TraB/GumN family protein [Flavobacteriales bacterium]|nr:TraB/GumN family protein [Flavobacteriales bacterium]
MRAPAFYCLLLHVLGALGQGTPKTTLWRVSAPQVAGSSYLFGTVHSRDDRAYQWGDSVLPALRRVQVVAGELDIEREQGRMLGLMSLALLPEGRTLKDYYRKREWRRVEAGLKHRLGTYHGMALRLRPYFVLLMLSGVDIQGQHERVLDEEIQYLARANGQEIVGLETLREQMGAMDVLSLERQAQLLLERIDSGDEQAELDRLLGAYAAQDLDALMEVMDASGALPVEMDASLIVERNARMAHRIDSLLSTGTSAFFAVGAAHLPRETGLIALLRDRGYAVEPIISAPSGTRSTAPAMEIER